MTVSVQCPRKRRPRQPTTMLSTPIPSDSDTQRNLQPRRDALSYSIDRLSRRNEIVLKSSMRVLDHRFRHRWTAVDSGGDVRITAHEAGAGAGVEAALHLGSSLVPDAFFVQLPLRAQDLETTFNRIGEELIQTRDLQRSTDLSFWVACCIAAPHHCGKKPRDALSNLVFFIHVSMYLLQMCNFHTMQAVVSGLSRTRKLDKVRVGAPRVKP